jgi:hypothetical protein
MNSVFINQIMMKNYTGSVFFLFFFLFAGVKPLYSQVAINTDNSPPDPSAMLDIQSTNKGLLIPRIDFNDRPVPAPPGLMIFVTANGPYGNNALYIYNGVGWSALDFDNLTIGKYTGGGVVFYIDPSGLHGLISSTVDQTTYARWGCDTTTLIGPGAENTGLETGDANTTAIVNSCSNPTLAAGICDTLTRGGFTDWYLPARDELDSMFVHRNIIGGFNYTSFHWYWTSTEHDAPGAWIVDFNSTANPNTGGWTNKFVQVFVRCIRKF